MRSLLQHSHGGHSHGAEPELAHGLEPDVHASTLDLRVAAIFVILFGASLFGLLTLRIKSPDSLFARLMRAFSGGVILALALVHIIPEAVGELNSLMEFPIGGCTILAGIVLLVLIDSILAAFLAPKAYKEQILAGESHAHHGHSGEHQHQHHSKKAVHSVHVPGHPDHSDHKHSSDHKHGSAAALPPAKVVTDYEAAAAADPAADAEQAVRSVGQTHGHQCMRSLNASGWISSAAAPMRSMRQCVTAYTMEFGCIFHSVIIGVGVGVITEDRQLVTTLMIALAIHQGLEALALGSVLALTSFSVVKKFAMLLLYSLTTPIGIAIGIAISTSYDPESVTSRAVQGTLNGVSGGMLLYIAMQQLISEEFSREDLLVRPKLRYGMYASLLLGAAVMCIIGIWA